MQTSKMPVNWSKVLGIKSHPKPSSNCYIKADCFPMAIRKKLMGMTEKGQAKLVALTGGAMDIDEVSGDVRSS